MKNLKTIDLNFDIKDLNGNNVQPISNAGQIVAEILMSEVKGDPIKCFDWAMTLNKREPISVDASDFIKLKDFITSTEKLILLAKAQLLKHFEKIK